MSAWSNIYDVEYSRQKYGYILNQVGFDLAMMFVIGSVYRIIAYILLMRSSIFAASTCDCCCARKSLRQDGEQSIDSVISRS